jgi:hypothetical protein
VRRVGQVGEREGPLQPLAAPASPFICQNSCIRRFVARKTGAQAGVTWPDWKKSQRCTAARRSIVGGSSPAAGYFSATYPLMAFDSQSWKVPSTSAGIFPIGFTAT